MSTRKSGRAVEGLRDPNRDRRTCCLCGGTRFRLIHSWEADHPRNNSTLALGFWQCDCNLAILHPVPSERQLPDQGDFRSPKRKRVFRNYRIKHYREKLQNAVFGTQVQRFVAQTRKAQPDGRLLDVWCGAGERLKHAAPHYQCVGLDGSCQYAQPARDLGFPVIIDQFDSAFISSASFDVVMMDSTLHHQADPINVLRKANRILAPGGVVAVKVPKLWGFSHWLHDREWNGYRIGYHLTMFNSRTMDAVMSAAGFQALKHPRRDRRLDDILIVWGRKVREEHERGYAQACHAA